MSHYHTKKPAWEDLKQVFDQGDFQGVVTTLEGRASTAPEYRLLGQALVSLGHFEAAELALGRAHALQDDEGSVEYGNVLRLLGRFQEAHEHLERIAPQLIGDLQCRCQRWLGVTTFKLGQTTQGIRIVRQAWQGYIRLSDELAAASTHVSLAQIFSAVGKTRSALIYLREALKVLPAGPDPAPRLSALHNLMGLQIDSGDLAGAAITLEEAKHLAQRIGSRKEEAMVLATEADLKFHCGDYPGYQIVLETLQPLAEQIWEHELHLWATCRLAEHYSLNGHHSQAMATLMRFGQPQREWPAELWACQGVLAWRRGQSAEALRDLEHAAHLFRTAESLPELIRVLLHQAAAALQEQEHRVVATVLREALEHLLYTRQFSLFRADFQELQHLFHYALLEPDIAPYLEPVLNDVAQLAGLAPYGQDDQTVVAITTLGQPKVHLKGQEVNFKFTGSLPVLTYLTLHPGQTRAEIQLALFPERHGTTAKSYLRQCFKDLRTHLGEGIVSSTGSHQAPQYSIGSAFHIDLDLVNFREALKTGDTARMLALYRGAFLPLEELDPSEWTERVRNETRLGLALDLQQQINTHQREGDHERLVLAANQYLRVEPHDDAMLRLRLASAKTYASIIDIARYTSELHELYN
jgi:DNA-binding SARP family transcriptional activator